MNLQNLKKWVEFRALIYSGQKSNQTKERINSFRNQFKKLQAMTQMKVFVLLTDFETLPMIKTSWDNSRASSKSPNVNLGIINLMMLKTQISFMITGQIQRNLIHSSTTADRFHRSNLAEKLVSFLRRLVRRKVGWPEINFPNFRIHYLVSFKTGKMFSILYSWTDKTSGKVWNRLVFKDPLQWI